jgi:hypothetical protein
MTVLTFPTNPTNGQRYSAPNGIQYVYDGVKWVVETTSSSSGAITNSMQDRVAPMFVDGANTGITFAYNAATNVMSASVTAVNGNQLVNGSRSVTLESNGNITAPAFTIPNAVGTSGQVLKWPSSGSTLTWAADSSTTNKLVNGANELVLGTDGKLTLPGGGGLQSVGVTGSDGRQSLASTRTDGSLFLTANSATAGDVYLMGQQNYIISASNISNGATYKTWTFAQSGNITLPAGGDILDSTGNSVLGGGGSGSKLQAKKSYDEVWSVPNGTVFSTQIGGYEISIQIAANQDLYLRGLLKRLYSHFDNGSTFYDNYENIQVRINPDTNNILANVTNVAQVNNNPPEYIITVDAVAPGGSLAVNSIRFLYDFYNTAGFDLEDDSFGMVTDDDDIEIRSGRDIYLFADDDILIRGGSVFELELRREDDQDPNDGIRIRTSDEGVDKDWTFQFDGNITLPAGGDILDSTGTSVLNNGVSITDFGVGFVNTLDSGKITTSKLYNKNPNPGLNNQYELSVDNGGVVHLPDQSVINGATLKTVPGNYAGITAGPVGKDEDSWVWVDNDGAWIATKFSTTAYTWHFDNNGKLTLPTNGTISYAPDDTDNWNAPAVNTLSAALDELALRLKAVENIEIEGGNAYAMAGPELIIDGNGA